MVGGVCAGMGLVALGRLNLGWKRWVGAKGSTLSQTVPPSPSHKDLLEAGELKWGTDEAQFIYILGRRSRQHLRLGEHHLPAQGGPGCILAASPGIFLLSSHSL